MTNGNEVANELIAGRDGGLPWFTIVRPTGEEIISSIGPGGNIGFPLSPSDVAHFIKMLEQSSQKSAEQLETIREALVQIGINESEISEAEIARTAEAEPSGFPECPDLPVDPQWKALSETQKIWLDMEANTLVVGAQVCHREGPLEFFACPPNTKEYESIVVVDCEAFKVHAGLLAIGLEPGHPVKFMPDYESATGPILDIRVEWQAEGELKSVRAQDWVRHDPTDKRMPFDWVFAGSRFWTDEQTGKEHYFAEGGELICLSNFSTATIDLPIKSSQDNARLLFSAFTEQIPPLGTKLHLKLQRAETTIDGTPIQP